MNIVLDIQYIYLQMAYFSDFVAACEKFSKNLQQQTEVFENRFIEMSRTNQGLKRKVAELEDKCRVLNQKIETLNEHMINLMPSTPPGSPSSLALSTPFFTGNKPACKRMKREDLDEKGDQASYSLLNEINPLNNKLPDNQLSSVENQMMESKSHSSFQHCKKKVVNMIQRNGWKCTLDRGGIVIGWNENIQHGFYCSPVKNTWNIQTANQKYEIISNKIMAMKPRYFAVINFQFGNNDQQNQKAIDLMFEKMEKGTNTVELLSVNVDAEDIITEIPHEEYVDKLKKLIKRDMIDE